MALDGNKRQFIDENPFVGIATTLRDDGSPHSTVVWVDVEDGKVSFNTVRGRAKERHLQKDPRVSLLVVDPENAYKWVSVSGHAQLTEEGADAQIDRLAKKYLGKDEYPWRDPEQTRVKVLIEPEQVDATGLDE
jgi:PPOX class probable F420-dependent enzyme